MGLTVRSLAKHVLAGGLARTGAWSAILRTWAWRDATLVLTYHRVLDKWEPELDYSQPGMVVTGPTFERHLDFLARHFEIVPLGALLDERAERPVRRPRCIITFDDGWCDNYEIALPILRKRGLPATIYLTTDFIGTERVFWHTELIYLLVHADLSGFLCDPNALSAYPRAVGDALRQCAGSARGGAAAVDTLVETVKAACEEDVIHDLIATLTGAAGFDRPLFPARRFFLDWDQVRQMAAHGFEIGSHGCTHRIMTRLSPTEAGEELARSKAEIEHRVGRRVEHFAFPNEDTSAPLMNLVGRAGYRTACVGAAAKGTMVSGLRPLRRAGMHEGVGGPEATHDALLGLALLRAPKSWPA